MKLEGVLVLALVGVYSGCHALPKGEVTYLEVRLENAAEVDVSDVALGRVPQRSVLGALGKKGAGATAVVPVQLIQGFPVTWQEDDDRRVREAGVDLSAFEGVKNRAIVLRYKGNSQWDAELGREVRPLTKMSIPGGREPRSASVLNR